MIWIGKPSVTQKNDVVRLSAALLVGEKQASLWLEVDSQYAHGLCEDRVDAFVVGLLPYAIKFRHDISFDAPMTDLLKEQLERDFLDVICQQEPGLYHVKLHGKTLSPIYKNKTVRAMGLSCGVDCLYTVRNRMLDPSFGERYFVMSDAHLRSKNDTDESASRRFSPLYENGKEFAGKLGIPLIVVHTNWGPQAIEGLQIENNTTYCNCFVALCLQKLITHYYLASGGPIRDFAVKYIKNGLHKTDCSDFDLLALGAYSSPAIRFIVDGLEERVAKIRTIIDWPLCHDNLDVCEMHRRRVRGNDTYDCHKCMHTVAEILSQGGFAALEKFNKVFDVEYVKAHKAEYLAYIICQRIEKSEVGMEIWNGRGCFEVAWIDYFKATLIILWKMFRKIYRRRGTIRSWADI